MMTFHRLCSKMHVNLHSVEYAYANIIKHWLKTHYRLRNYHIAGLIVLANIQYLYSSRTSTSSNIMQGSQGPVFFKRADVLGMYVVSEASPQMAADCSMRSSWRANWVFFHSVRFCHGIPSRPGSCRSKRSVCLWGGRSAKTVRSLHVCNKRWGTGFMGIVLWMDWLFSCRGSGGLRHLRWHSPACWNKGQRRELDSSNDAISRSVTGRAFIRVSQDVIWVYHESLNWERPFTKHQWQILSSHCAEAQITVNMQR